MQSQQQVKLDTAFSSTCRIEIRINFSASLHRVGLLFRIYFSESEDDESVVVVPPLVVPPDFSRRLCLLLRLSGCPTILLVSYNYSQTADLRLTFYIVRCEDLECLSITREFRTSFSTTHAANQQRCKCNQRESSQTA